MHPEDVQERFGDVMMAFAALDPTTVALVSRAVDPLAPPADAVQFAGDIWQRVVQQTGKIKSEPGGMDKLAAAAGKLNFDPHADLSQAMAKFKTKSDADSFKNVFRAFVVLAPTLTAMLGARLLNEPVVVPDTLGPLPNAMGVWKSLMDRGIVRKERGGMQRLFPIFKDLHFLEDSKIVVAMRKLEDLWK